MMDIKNNVYYFDQNVWQHFFEKIEAEKIAEHLRIGGVAIYLSTHNVYEFGRMLLSGDRNDENKVSGFFKYLFDLCGHIRFIKGPHDLILDDISYARNSGKILPFLNVANTGLSKQEIYNIAHGNNGKAVDFIKRRESRVESGCGILDEKARKLNSGADEIKFEKERDNVCSRREILRNSKYGKETTNLSDGLLFSEPARYPFLNTFINSQLYLNYLAAFKINAKSQNHVSDLRHLILANAAKKFVTMDERLIKLSGKVCPYIETLNLEGFMRIENF